MLYRVWWTTYLEHVIVVDDSSCTSSVSTINNWYFANLSVMETRFSASEYTHVLPTSTHAAQGCGGLPAQRVFRPRHRLHLYLSQHTIRGPTHIPHTLPLTS